MSRSSYGSFLPPSQPPSMFTPSFSTTNIVSPTTPMNSRATKEWRKTIALISLTSEDSRNQPSSSKASSCNQQSVKHKVITQIMVNMDSSKCTVSAVAGLVKEQVGVDVVLMDSKCYPLYENYSTSGVEFWKSGRRILATSQHNYENIIGKPPVLTLGAIFPVCPNDKAPTPKRSRSKDDDQPAAKSPIEEKIDSILTDMKSLKSLNELLQIFPPLLQCPICKDTVTNPVVSPCCGSISGCQSCVNQWVEVRNCCPLCGLDGDISGRIRISGFDPVIMIVKNLEFSNTFNSDRTRLHVPPAPSPLEFDDTFDVSD